MVCTRPSLFPKQLYGLQHDYNNTKLHFEILKVMIDINNYLQCLFGEKENFRHVEKSSNSLHPKEKQ